MLNKLISFIEYADVKTLECMGYIVCSCVLSCALIGLVFFFG